MTCRPPRPLGQFLVSYVRRFKQDHPDIGIAYPFDTASGKFEVTERGVISTYETGTAMIVDLWDRYPESAFRELSLDPKTPVVATVDHGGRAAVWPRLAARFASDLHRSGKATGPSLVASGRWRGTPWVFHGWWPRAFPSKTSSRSPPGHYPRGSGGLLHVRAHLDGVRAHTRPSEAADPTRTA